MSLRGDVSQHRAALQDVFDRLLGGGVIESAFFLQPRDGFRHRGLAGRNPDGRSVTQAVADFSTQTSHMSGKFLSSRRGLAAPEGNAGRCAVSIFHQHAPRFALHATDAPRGVAQQHDVAGIAFDREVFVERADHNAVGLGDDGEERGFRNGAAAGDGRQPAAPPRPQFPVHAVAMDVSAITPAPRCNALGEHFENRVVNLAGKIAIGIGARDQGEKFVFIPSAIGRYGFSVARAPRLRLERHLALEGGGEDRPLIDKPPGQGGATL